jgi:predicted glycosyltransferase
MTHGIEPERDNFLVRVVAWRANHDVGKKGWTPEVLREVIAQLSSLGKVHLSSELPLPDELEPLRYRGPSAKIHHLLGHCRLLVGESATLASEAAILGVPSIYAGRDFPCYVRALEAVGLAMNVAERTPEAISGAIDEALARPLAEIADARDAYVAACPDWAEVVVQALDDCVYQAGRNPRLTSEARP